MIGSDGPPFPEFEGRDMDNDSDFLRWGPLGGPPPPLPGCCRDAMLAFAFAVRVGAAVGG